MKIKSIKIENMHKVKEATYELADIEYIVGNNGAGKTTILEAIQLAILGYIPGFSKRNMDIIKHASGKCMTVRVEFDDGNYILREYYKKANSASCEVSHSFGEDENGNPVDTSFIVGNLELPIFNFNSFLNLSANEQKKWFLDFLPKADASINWKAQFEDATKDLIDYDSSIVDELVEDINLRELADVKAVHEYIKSCISFTKGQISSKQNVLADLVYYNDVENMNSESLSNTLADLNSRLMTCKNKISAVNYAATLKSDRDNVEKSLPDTVENTKAKIQTLEKEITNLKETELASIQKEIEKSKEKVDSAYTKSVEAANIFRATTDPKSIEDCCPYTQTKCDKVSQYKDEITKKYEEAEANYKTAYDEYQTIYSEYNALESKLKDINSQIVQKGKILDSYQSAIKRYSYVNNVYTEYLSSTELNTEDSAETIRDEIDFVNSEIKRYHEIEEKVKSNEIYNKIKHSAESDLANYEIKLNHLIKLKDHTGPNNMQAWLAEKPFNDLKENMTKYLKLMFNEDVECMFTLSSKSNSFEFGILRNGIYIPFTTLSSGEKCIYMIALQSCLISESKSSLHTILIDDLFDHLDKENAASLINSMKKTDCQFIVAGVNEIEDNEITTMRL